MSTYDAINSTDRFLSLHDKLTILLYKTYLYHPHTNDAKNNCPQLET
jgi:hypothetical protein